MPDYEEIYAVLIKGNEIVNTIVVDSSMNGYDEFIASLDADRVEIVGERDRPSPGWSWDGKKWSPPPLELSVEEVTEPIAAPPTLEERLGRIEQLLEELKK